MLLLIGTVAGGLGAAGAGRVGAQGTRAVSSATAHALVDSIARVALAERSIPGMSVVVMRGPATLIATGYGMADRESGAPATAGTVYQLGSISKQFTAAAVMRLVERGALRFEDPVSRHLPEYRPQGDSVRLRHLLHQTSGVREEFTLPRYGELISDTTRQNAELMILIEREPLGFAPGSRWSYSNSNYALLAAVIERTTGKPYDRFLAEEFFAPLGLVSLHHCAPLPTAPHHARRYVLESGRTAPAPPENMNWIRGDGGLCGTARDLARWTRALATGAP
jgi:CubicO group peptidase (beta-lactamase class C family)